MIESEADRLAYLQAFGVSIDAERGSLLGIFDRAYVDANGIDEAAPAIECRESDVRALQIQKGTRLTFSGVTYRVRRHEPDGTGMSRLVLET